MIPGATSLSLAMRGGDAARMLLAGLGVIKRSDILDRSGFDDAARRLALALLAEVEGPTDALAAQLQDELGLNWAALTPARREAALSKAERLIGELGRKIAPDLAKVLRGNAPTLIKASRQAAIGRFQLPIAAKLDESGVDAKAMEHLANAHELFVRDQYGRISTIFGARARALVTTGISQGYDYQEIGKDMFAAIGAQLGKGQPYCTMVASVFVARARSASILASFDEAEIEKFELSAVLDEATCFAGWTRVLLGDGKTWAPIHKLRAGDVVMSCKGRPRHVVRRIESKARTWVSLQVRGARRPIQVTQTHGILTPSGWVRAQHLHAEGDLPASKRPITRVALYDPANQRLDAGRLWSDEREWGMRLGRIDPHTVDCHPFPAPDLAHLGAYGAFGEILEAEQETLGQTPTSCADAFDLTVDEDHGYIAEGVIVHNSNICRALDGKVFYTREAIAKLEQVARAEAPDAIKDLQPFVQDGKDEEGNPILYANQGGARVQVARVVESGAGKRDERGKYQGMLNEAKLSSMGITIPPFHGHCFPGETEIATPSGLRRIDGIAVGEVVLGGLYGDPRAVTQVHRREFDGDLVVVETRSGRMRMTPEHPVGTGRGWVEAGKLRITDTIRRLPEALSIRIDVLRREPFAGTVYNLAVDVDESYVVGELVVHNCRTLAIPAGFDTVGGGSRGGDTAPTQVQVPVAVRPPPKPVAAPQPVAPEPAPRQPPTFADGVRTLPLKNEVAFGAGGINQISTAEIDGQRVFVKPATTKGVDGARTTFDPQDAVTMHEAVRRTADALGIGDTVQPAAVRAMSGEALKFVTRSAPGAMGVVAEAPATTLAKISERTRLAGAVTDFLHRNSDRHANNVLVNEDGQITLIDHDRAHGHVPTKAYDQAKSIFFPTGHIGYAVPQKAFVDLPPEMRAHVQEVAAASAADIVRLFGLTPEEAGAMRARAQSLAANGLDAALALDKAKTIRDLEGEQTYIKTVGRE